MGVLGSIAEDAPRLLGLSGGGEPIFHVGPIASAKDEPIRA